MAEGFQANRMCCCLVFFSFLLLCFVPPPPPPCSCYHKILEKCEFFLLEAGKREVGWRGGGRTKFNLWYSPPLASVRDSIFFLIWQICMIFGTIVTGNSSSRFTLGLGWCKESLDILQSFSNICFRTMTRVNQVHWHFFSFFFSDWSPIPHSP